MSPTSPTSCDLDLVNSSVNSSESEEDVVDHNASDHHQENCMECKHRQHAALLDSLPAPVIGGI